jgi:hypothetical protein
MHTLLDAKITFAVSAKNCSTKKGNLFTFAHQVLGPCGHRFNSWQRSFPNLKKNCNLMVILSGATRKHQTNWCEHHYRRSSQNDIVLYFYCLTKEAISK